MGRLTSLPSAVVTDDSALGGAEIERSLRFNDNDGAYLSRTPSSAGNRKTWTWSAWIRRGNLGSRQILFSADDNATQATYFMLELQSDDNLRCLAGSEGASATCVKETAMVIRDNTSWYHLVFKFDATNASAVWYVNGQEITDLNSSTNPSNQDFQVNATSQHFLGRYGSSLGTSYFDGYMAEINFIDGFALDASYFGYTDFQTGLWRPKGYFGSYGTNGVRLDFSDNSATTAVTLGKDRSGQGNDFTLNNIVVSDAVLDTPTNVFSTFNSKILSPEMEFEDGNLHIDVGANHHTGYASISLNTGKWYWEGKAKRSSGSLTKWTYGVSDDRNASNKQVSSTNYLLANTSNTYANGDAVSIYGSTFYKNGSSTSSYQTHLALDDIVAIALDVDAGKVWFARNGTWVNGSASASTTLNPDSHDTTVTTGQTYVPAFSAEGVDWEVNFGQDDTFSGTSATQGNKDENGQGNFYYPVPSGFKAICSHNLPITTPPIFNPKKHFDTLLYAGDGSSGRSITGLQFQPDFVWIKSRTNTRQAQITNSMVGAGKILVPSETDAEQTISGVSAFNHNGFTIGSHVGANENSQNFVAWCWKAGGAAVSNSDGTISSQVSVNREAGFSIATWTSDGSGSPTSFGHGLGIRPDFILIKSRDSNYNWTVWSSTFSNATNNFLILNINNGTQTAGAAMWGTIDSSVVNFRHSANSSNGDDMVGFFFSSVKGFSKFGSYTGNGSSDGPYVYLGFRPAWVMIKMSGSSGHWIMFDNKRDPFNYCDTRLYANQTNADTGSYNVISMTSNGFKFENQYDGSWNQNGTKFIYLAFAEQIGDSPFVTETNAR